MAKLFRLGLGLLLVGGALSGCDGDGSASGGGQPPPFGCEGVTCNLTLPAKAITAHLLAFDTVAGVYVADIQASQTLSPSPSKLSLNVPPDAKASLVGVPVIAGAVQHYNKQHTSGVRGAVVALTRAGEVILDDSQYVGASDIAEQSARLWLWDPQSPAKAPVAILQHRKNSAAQYLYDAAGDQLVFVEHDEAANKDLLKRRTLSGTEETLLSSPSIRMLAREIAAPYKEGALNSAMVPEIPEPTTNAYVVGGTILLQVDDLKTVVVDLAKKSTSEIAVAAQKPTLLESRVHLTGNGTPVALVARHYSAAEFDTFVVRLDQRAEWKLLTSAQERIDGIYPVALTANEMVVMVTGMAEVPHAEWRVYALDQAAPLVTIPAMLDAPSLGASQLVGGPQLQSGVQRVVARLGDGYLLSVREDLCDAAAPPAKSFIMGNSFPASAPEKCNFSAQSLVRYAANGTIERVGSSAFAFNDLLLVDPVSRRALVRDAQGVAVVDLADGGHVATLADTTVVPVDANSETVGQWNNLGSVLLARPGKTDTGLSVLRNSDLGAIPAGGTVTLTPLTTVDSAVQSASTAGKGTARTGAVVADTLQTKVTVTYVAPADTPITAPLATVKFMSKDGVDYHVPVPDAKKSPTPPVIRLAAMAPAQLTEPSMTCTVPAGAKLLTKPSEHLLKKSGALAEGTIEYFWKYMITVPTGTALAGKTAACTMTLAGSSTPLQLLHIKF